MWLNYYVLKAIDWIYSHHGYYSNGQHFQHFWNFLTFCVPTYLRISRKLFILKKKIFHTYSESNTSSWHISDVDEKKYETMHSDSDGTTGFHEIMSFLNDFGECTVLNWHYQLPFLLSGRFPGKMNWTEAQQAYCVQIFLESEPVTSTRWDFRLYFHIACKDSVPVRII